MIMSLFDKFTSMAANLESLASQGIEPFGIPIESVISPTEAIIHGRKFILAGTNNYLGLNFNADCLAAAHTALDELGTGTTGSRMANGNLAIHRALEQEFADFYGCKEALIFTTGYQANLAVISGMTNHNDVIMIDADSHASIYDACKLSGAEVIRFRHNNAADLDKRLKRLGTRSQNTLIIIEGIYSMLGDQTPIQDMVEVKNKYGSLLMVDEAHSLGVLGDRGCGLVEVADVIQDVDLIVGTFSKSLANIGGYCVSPHKAIEILRYVSRPYIFTASLSPATIASTRVALKHLEEGRHLRKRLWSLSNKLYAHLNSEGYITGPTPGPVIAVLLDSREQAVLLWQNLYNNNVYVNLVFPPATPGGQYLVRCSVSAAHTDEQLEQICEVFSASKKQLDCISSLKWPVEKGPNNMSQL